MTIEIHFRDGQFFNVIKNGLEVPGFSPYGISQARILEWVAISFSNEDLAQTKINI